MTMRSGTMAFVLLCAGCVVTSPLGALEPPTSQRFDVNDVSYLWPPPTTREHVDALMTSIDRTADGTPVWPDAAFTSVMETAQKTSVTSLAGTPNTITFDEQFKADLLKASTWKIVAFRVDPSAPGGQADLVERFGAMPQLRLVMQPVTVDATGRVRVHDMAAHLVFGYYTGGSAPPFTPDTARFREMVGDLEALKAAAGIDTRGSLGVHPALKTRDVGFATLVKAFIARHTSPSRSKLFAISFTGIEPPEPWIFFATVVTDDGRVVPAPQPVLNRGHVQMLGLLNAPAAQPVPSVTNVDASAGKGVSTGVLFASDIRDRFGEPVFADRARPLHRDIADLVANPRRAHVLNTDCVSCHTESARRVVLNMPEGDGMFRFGRPAGISGVDEAMLPNTKWNARNFGWFQRNASSPPLATVTMRTANEAAEAAELINRSYLAASSASPGPQLLRASLRSAGSSSPSRVTTENTHMPETVANPLTLVMNIKSPEDYLALKALIEKLQALPPDKNPIVAALTKLKTVHYARFVFLGEHQLAVITTYDGSFEDYIDAFVLAIGPIFDQLLGHMRDAPPLPVSSHRDEFLEYVKKHDLTCVPPFYSAYPALTVQQILTLQKQQGTAR